MYPPTAPALSSALPRHPQRRRVSPFRLDNNNIINMFWRNQNVPCASNKAAVWGINNNRVYPSLHASSSIFSGCLLEASNLCKETPVPPQAFCSFPLTRLSLYSHINKDVAFVQLLVLHSSKFQTRPSTPILDFAGKKSMSSAM